MSARATVHSLLQDDSDIAAEGVEVVYASNSVDTPAEQCFIIVRWDTSAFAFKKTGVDRCSVWVHDRNRDYGRIDRVLHRVKELLTDAVHVEGEDGWTLTLAEWRGDGPDLVDNGFNTVTRYSDFVVASRYTTT